jgi:hypothetical protein
MVNGRNHNSVPNARRLANLSAANIGRKNPAAICLQARLMIKVKTLVSRQVNQVYQRLVHREMNIGLDAQIDSELELCHKLTNFEQPGV